ncbi:F-box protein cpr1 [Thalictrum thalictroides]|uniref:F-box protein cpr1 n=1 Tax=Thalictrum thalictroides TaxID=46969 RepID=A0A7J6WGN2_THATH|nr:F-box protein cpr1 [Thalictrum thalictroides]
MSSLPEEIIMEIITRLPRRSLFRFKCVSKPWFKVISERESPANNLLLAGDKHLVRTPLFSVEGTSFDETVEIENPKKNHHHKAAVALGCCNGIVCLGQTYSVCLLNPSTKEYKIVDGFDKEEFVHMIGFNKKFNVYGFGYDQTNKYYKLVQFGWRISDQAIVYSLNMDTCSKIFVKIGPYNFSNRDQLGIYIGDAIHWIVRRNFDSTVVIICFDMKENAFREMLPPVAGHTNTLGVLEEKLCFLCRYKYRGGIIDIWVMKTYNISDSWYKLFSIGKNVPPFTTNHPTRVLCFAQSGKVVLRHGKKLLVYDPKDETFTYMNYKGVCWNFIKSIVPYVASPVPLKSGTYLRSVRTSEKVTQKRRREV